MKVSHFTQCTIDRHWGDFLLLTILDSPAIHTLKTSLVNIHIPFGWVVFELFYDCSIVGSFNSI